MILIDGKATAAQIRAEVAEMVVNLQKKAGITPGLAVIMVGNDPASAVYVRNKKKACDEVGFRSFNRVLPEDTSQEALIAEIDRLNADPAVHGILVQLPLPAGICENAVLARVAPEKDVDGFAPIHVGELTAGRVAQAYIPCTPAGMMELLRRYQIDPAGKRCVVVGRSEIVGKPMALLLLRANGTVTVCHSHTVDLASVTREADILVCAVGKAGLITGEMVKEGVVVLDAGTTRGADGKLKGDVDFATVAPKAAALTPVPGGVGPMTIAMLLRNTLMAAEYQSGVSAT